MEMHLFQIMAFENAECLLTNMKGPPLFHSYFSYLLLPLLLLPLLLRSFMEWAFGVIMTLLPLPEAEWLEDGRFALRWDLLHSRCLQWCETATQRQGKGDALGNIHPCHRRAFLLLPSRWNRDIIRFCECQAYIQSMILCWMIKIHLGQEQPGPTSLKLDRMRTSERNLKLIGTYIYINGRMVTHDFSWKKECSNLTYSFDWMLKLYFLSVKSDLFLGWYK